jgi:hypothetical protein
MHVVSFDAVEYFPTAHAVQVVAPVPGPVFVIKPPAHEVHAATFDAFEYLPAAHAVQLVPLALVPVSVIEPAAQSEQDA